MAMSAVETDGNKVVVRYLDGHMLKGVTHDFAANKEKFHVFLGGDASTRGTPVTPDGLKAVFFVKDHTGNSAHKDVLTFDGAKGQGRRIAVTFIDGETVTGFTMAYNAAAPGFFLVPVDRDGNNVRVFVIHNAVREVNWL
jgi:hypothetical protein